MSSEQVAQSALSGCPRCGIGTPIFVDSCIVCCHLNDSIASLIKELLSHKLRAEKQLSEAIQERDRARAEVAKARKDALEEAAESMCQFCRREHGALPAKWNGKSWIHTKRTEESAGIVCSAQAIHALAAKDTQEGE